MDNLSNSNVNVINMIMMIRPIFIPSKYPFSLQWVPIVNPAMAIDIIGIISFVIDIIFGFNRLK